MKRFIIAVVSLGLGLVGLSDGVLAQTNSGLVVIDDASGSNGTNSSTGNCEVSGSGRDRLVRCTDMSPGRGVALTDPGTEPAPPPDPATEPVPAPDAESAPESTDTAVATAADQDADNAADELEPGMGLDPTNPDTDGDHVADGDEPNIYGTDPLNPDTDGDGVLDGEELFATHTDPLVAS
jgi:Bacterial TSP3 repeat